MAFVKLAILIMLTYVDYIKSFCYTIYNEKYFSERHFSYIVRVLTWRAWRRAELLLAIAEML